MRKSTVAIALSVALAVVSAGCMGGDEAPIPTTTTTTTTAPTGEVATGLLKHPEIVVEAIRRRIETDPVYGPKVRVVQISLTYGAAGVIVQRAAEPNKADSLTFALNPKLFALAKPDVPTLTSPEELNKLKADAKAAGQSVTDAQLKDQLTWGSFATVGPTGVTTTTSTMPAPVGSPGLVWINPGPEAGIGIWSEPTAMSYSAAAADELPDQVFDWTVAKYGSIPGYIDQALGLAPPPAGMVNLREEIEATRVRDVSIAKGQFDGATIVIGVTGLRGSGVLIAGDDGTVSVTVQRN